MLNYFMFAVKVVVRGLAGLGPGSAQLQETRLSRITRLFGEYLLEAGSWGFDSHFPYCCFQILMFFLH